MTDIKDDTFVVSGDSDHLEHYGILRRSGRYPWGSGGDYDTKAGVHADYLRYVADMRKAGLSNQQIADGLGITQNQLRAAKTIAIATKLEADIAMAQSLKAKGMSGTKAAERMGIPEPTYRSLLQPDADRRARILRETSNQLKQRVAEVGYLDVGAGTEIEMGISKEKLQAAIDVLKEEGYETYKIRKPQATTNFDTPHRVLVAPGVTKADVLRNKDKIQTLRSYTEDGGETYFRSDHTPLAIGVDRVHVRWGDEGGDKADGVIHVKPGVEDLDMGGNLYSQVRIAVSDKSGKTTHYLKGMALVREDMDPNGPDIIFNTPKLKKDVLGEPGAKENIKLGAMKPIKDDPDLPFGTVIKRQILADAGTKDERPKSVMNLVNEEGNWGDWSESLSSQMLAKQSPKLIDQQLRLTQERRRQDLDEIKDLTNPTVRKKLLLGYADQTDAAAVHLKAAGMAGQAWHVILPFESIAPHEVYCPTRKDGEKVALIRYPHAGTFEIPELRVNNRNAEARRIIGGDKTDVIGIHPSVASRLSGADFDGDTVLVIPNNKGSVKSSPALQGLKDFDPHKTYKLPETAPPVSKAYKEQKMGDVSNLIMDMQLKGASEDELVRAVRHSMVVIDAEKHHLNIPLSAKREGISALKEKYQGRANAGAATLISRRKKKSDWQPQTRPRHAMNGGPIDPQTGARVWEPTNFKVREAHKNKQTGQWESTGEMVLKQEKVLLLDRTSDAHSLSSGTATEKKYADHSNYLKGLANEARLEALKARASEPKQNKSAKEAFGPERTSLLEKLREAERNAPRERAAQHIANAEIRERRRANPDLSKDTVRKLSHKALKKARARTGAESIRIHIEDKEWDAIQAGALSKTDLNKILLHADMDRVRELATPRSRVLMTPLKTQRAQSMRQAGFTRAEIAQELGVSVTTLDRAFNE